MQALSRFVVLGFLSFTVLLTACSSESGDDEADPSPSGGAPGDGDVGSLESQQPSEPTFFDGLWESSLELRGAPCTGDLAALPLEQRDPDYFYYQATGPTSFSTHYCSTSADCSAAPAAGFTMEIVDGFWTNQKIVRNAPEEGDICTAVDVQMVVIGEGFYRIDTEYEAPGRLAVESGQCLGLADGAQWSCRSRDVELYQRSEADFTLD